MIAIAPASTARRIPLAQPFSFTRNIDRNSLTVSLARVRFGIIHALGVSFTSSRVEGVGNITTSVAVSSNSIPNAHGRNKRTFSLVAERADLLALTSDRIETAISMSIAARLGHATSFASRLTNRSRINIQPLASRNGSASTFRSEASTLGIAELS